MITRYVPMGLLCILLFLGCTTVKVKESGEVVESIDDEHDINLLIEKYKHDPEMLLSKILEVIDPEDLSFNPLLARLELAIGRYNSAIQRIKMIPVYDDSAENLKIIVIAKIALNEDYTVDVQRILEIDSLHSFANNLKAKDLMKSGDLDHAESILTSVLKGGSGNSDTYVILGDLTLKRVDSLNLSKKKVLNSREEQTVTNLYNRSLNYYLKSGESGNALFYVKLSEVYKKLGKKLEAVQALDKAVELDPTDSWNYYDRGKLYFYMGSNSKAIKDLKESHRLNPEHFFSNVFLGRIYFIEGEIQNSLFHYRKVMAINPEYTPAYKDLSVLYQITGDSERGVNYLIKLYNSKTDKDPLLPLYLADSFIRVGREVDAKKIVQKLVKYEKNSTMKGIYNYYLDPKRTGDKALNDALLYEDLDQRMRLTYYVSSALDRDGVVSLSDALYREVADSNIGLESKLAKYKLGEKSE